MSDRTLTIAFCLSLCWAVIALAIGGLLALFGVITFRDPTGQVVGLIASGPLMVFFAGWLASLPFWMLYVLLKEGSDGG